MVLREPRNSILIVSATQHISEQLGTLLPPSQYALTTVNNCGEARRALMGTDYDILLINAPLPDELGVELALDRVRRSSGGVILMVSAQRYSDISAQTEDYGVLTVEKPISGAFILTVLKLCAATRARLKAAEKKNETLSAKMDEIRVVNRAKWLLIQVLNMKEEQAHRYIEKQAMDLRLTKREVAESIIRTYQE